MPKHGQKTRSRAKRLVSAKKWIAAYRGHNLVRGYRKRFGVSDVCAVVELRMLGVGIPDTRLEQARRDEQARATQRARRKEKHAARTSIRDWDDEFASIIGYTEGGAAYGIPWSEWEGLDVW
ncbi:MAG TPA: hypothetical protein VFJ16_13900 [Longimicrobium sp.]|nr:hypothetical protein [Longimicrobium sp.]